MKNLLFLACYILLSVSLLAQKNTIEEIVSNPGKYETESVEVKGTVIQYNKSTSNTTAFYVLKSDYGKFIHVNTDEKQPTINKVYLVKGTVINEMGQPLIIEKSKICQDCTSVVPIEGERGVSKNLLLVIIIVGIILIAILIILLKMQKKSAIPVASESEIDSHKEVKTNDDTVIITHDTDFKTIRIEQNVPKTMKFMPGKLEIISGPDKGKSFMLAGYPTAQGAIVSLGRDHADWEK